MRAIQGIPTRRGLDGFQKVASALQGFTYIISAGYINLVNNISLEYALLRYIVSSLNSDPISLFIPVSLK